MDAALSTMENSVLVGLALAISAGIGWWFARYAVSVLRGEYRHAEGRGQVSWIAGNGTHGGAGGQVPPLLTGSGRDEIR